jgi:hypothetical protein
MSQDENSPPKKDLTGIMDLPQADPVKDPNSAEGESSLEFNELKPIEQVDDFASLDQVGMMDHPVIEEPTEPEAPMEADPFQSMAEITPEEASPTESTDNQPELLDPFANFDAPQSLEDALNSDPVATDFDLSPDAPLPLDTLTEIPEPLAEDPAPVFAPLPPKPVLDDLRSYGESKKEVAFDPGSRNEFHLLITGDFDPYSRDKLLLFLTENSIGITSSELDFQIKSHRVLLPRISEFSGVKIIQDLRDSGLSFALKKSDEEPEFLADDGKSKSFHFEAGIEQTPLEVPILPASEFKPTEYRVLDSIQMVQYLRAEILEVEQSELFQDLLDRMTEALRKRAKLKGANALTHLSHRITPLRLPSQYQVELSASLLKRI